MGEQGKPGDEESGNWEVMGQQVVPVDQSIASG